MSFRKTAQVLGSECNQCWVAIMDASIITNPKASKYIVRTESC